jgi:hypothetical protein
LFLEGYINERLAMVNRDRPERAGLGVLSLQRLKAWREELAANVTSSRAREVEDLHER